MLPVCVNVAVKPKDFLERSIGFTINYTREDPHDPRELSEYPDIRVWFVRLDATYPWLPVLLDWRAGELARYAAMMVPHQVMLRTACFCVEKGKHVFDSDTVFICYGADEFENGNCFQPRGVGTVCDEESFHCVFLVEASQHSQA